MYAVDNGRRGGGLSGGGQFGRDQYDVESKYKQEEVVEEEEAPMTYYSEEVEEVDGIPAYQNEEPRFPCPVCGRKFMAQDRLVSNISDFFPFDKNSAKSPRIWD